LELDENLQPIRRYFYGTGKDDVEGYVEYSEVSGGFFDQSKQGWYTYIRDQVWTIYKVYSDYTNQMIDTRAYDTFGNLINRSGTSLGNHGFHSKYFDQESDLCYFFHRYYNPSFGRFINEDPIGFEGGMNFYSFVNNNPIKWIDPYGLVKRVRNLAINKVHWSPRGNNGSNTPGFTYSGETKYNEKTGKYYCEFTWESNADMFINLDSPESYMDIYRHEAQHIWDWWEMYDYWYEKLSRYEHFISRDPKKCDDFIDYCEKEIKKSIINTYWKTIKSVDGLIIWILQKILKSGIDLESYICIQ